MRNIYGKIPKVISDLSGATARKTIKNIREQNEASGDKAYKVSAFNEARGKVILAAVFVILFLG